MRRLLVVGSVGLLLVLVLSWVGVNVWLNTDSFSRLINGRSRNVLVEWTRARMIWPGHVELDGVRVRGNNRHVQWYVEFDHIAADIDLSALRGRVFRTASVRGQGIRYLMRRRLPEGFDLESTRNFPDIPGLAVEPVAPPRIGPPRPAGWHFEFQGIELEEVKELWVDEYRVLGSGRISADLKFQVRGLFSMDDLRLEFGAARVIIGSDTVSENLDMDIAIDLDKFMTHGAHFADVLHAWSGRVKLDGDIQGLGFLRYYLAHAQGLKISGGGRLVCDFLLDHGRLLPDTSMSLDTDLLAVSFPGFDFYGQGRIQGSVEFEAGKAVPVSEMRLSLHDVKVFRSSSEDPDVAEAGLDIVVRVHDPDYLKGFHDPEVMVNLSGLDIPDLGVFSDILPGGAGVKLSSGRAELNARLNLSPGLQETGDIRIRGKDVVLDLKGRPLALDLELDVPHHAGFDEHRLSIKGTSLLLKRKPLAGQTKAWSIGLEVDEGEMTMEARQGSGRKRWRSLRPADGRLALSGRISDLGLLNDYLAYGKWLELNGPADLAVNLIMKQRHISPGSSVRLEADALTARFLDWTVEGRAVVEGHSLKDDASELVLDFEDVEVSSAGKPHLRGSRLHLRAWGPDLGGHDGGLEGLNVRLELAQAEVMDLVTLNQYLPHSDILAFSGGVGSLGGHAQFSADGGDAAFHLAARGVSVQISGESIVTDLDLDLRMRTDRPASRRFDLDKVELRLSGTRWEGDSGHADLPWHADLALIDGEVTLTEPPVLDGTFKLELRDTRPLTYLLEKKSKALRWFDPWLTLKDVEGTAHVHLEDGELRLDDLELRSDEVNLSAALTLVESGPDGKKRVERLRVRGELARPLILEFKSLNDLLHRNGVFTFSSGRGKIEGYVDLTGDAVDVAFELNGERIMAMVRGESIETDLTFDIEMRTESIASHHFDIGGTRVRFDNTAWVGDK
ncbi:MAG: hypothetical protein E2P03_11130 [Acidobacteria bacterium]|nr:MAG: hypothetical protein E2P03_11130 [Acidobacteriota bacterium]